MMKESAPICEPPRLVAALAALFFDYPDARFQGGGILLCEAPLLDLHLDYDRPLLFG